MRDTPRPLRHGVAQRSSSGAAERRRAVILLLHLVPMPRLCLLAPALLLAALASCPAPCAASQQDPHPLSSDASSFEGWFIRLLTDDSSSSGACEDGRQRSDDGAASADSDGGSCAPPASWTVIVGLMPNAPASLNTSYVSLAVQSSR